MASRLPHALLVHGPAGIGKARLAEHIAQGLLCERAAGPVAPCGQCDGCRWFLGGNHPDVRRVLPEALAGPPGEEETPAPARKGRPSNEIKVDQVRELGDFLNLGSHRAGRRVALIFPAEAMNAHAANALLKSLEEPPGRAMFLLVSHRPAWLPPTVRSRCVEVPVAPPERALAGSWLAAQGIDDAQRWLDLAGGAPLRALELAGGAYGEALWRCVAALEREDHAALAAAEDRDALEALAEALQKHALDRALEALAGRGKYGTQGPKRRTGTASQWLGFARAMGRHRQLARHPLNPRLFAAQLLSEMPKS
jgi:DNA polymerase-3 subunit delta'